MVNLVWLFLILVGVIVAAINGNINAVSSAAFAAASSAVSLCIKITGIMALWLGLFKLAEKSGLVNILGNLASPLIGRLFPSLSRRDPAFQAIVMNVSANFLGLGNAATPFGLKAMQLLQEKNPEKDTASPAMITFLVMNTSALTLIPALVISLRSQAGSVMPGEIIGATFLATLCGWTFAIVLDRILRYFYYKGN